MWWKGFPVGHLFLFLWVCFWLQKAALGHLFPLPFGASSLIPLRTNFFPALEKMFFLLQVCFWIEAALAFRIYWDKVFCSCGSVFAQKQYWKTLFLWVCFFGMRQHWTRWWNWEDFRLSGREICRMKKKNWRTAGEIVWEFRTTDIKVRRFEHMCICISEGVRVWRWENLQMWRGHKIKKKGCENERMRLCEELKVWGQEYK